MGYISYLNRHLVHILKSNILDIPKEVNLAKIKFELFIYSISKLNLSYDKSKLISNNIVENSIDFIYEYIDIDEFFVCEMIIQNQEVFLLLLKKLKA